MGISSINSMPPSITHVVNEMDMHDVDRMKREEVLNAMDMHDNEVDRMKREEVLNAIEALNGLDNIEGDEVESSIRRYERLITRFLSFFGRATDVQNDIKERLLHRLGSAFDGQKSNLGKKTVGTVLAQGLGGVAGVIAALLSEEKTTWKNLMDTASKVLPGLGSAIAANYDADLVIDQKEQQLSNTAINSEDGRQNRLQSELQTLLAALNRLHEYKSRAHGG